VPRATSPFRRFGAAALLLSRFSAGVRLFRLGDVRLKVRQVDFGNVG
jgi:hypothetical protein